MSIIVNRNELTKEQVQQIATGLVMLPEKKFIPGNKFGSKTIEDSIQLYRKMGNDVYIPYTMCKKLLGAKAPSKPEVSITFKGQLRENQIDKAKEALDQLREHGTTTLQLDTAYGKTYISAYLATQLSRLTLVLHNMTILHKAWIKTFEDAAECFVWDANKKMPSTASVIICTTGKLSHIPKEVLSMVGTLIMDECHKLCVTDSIDAILQVAPEYIIGCSYTYEKTNGAHFFMDCVLGLHRVHGRLDINITAIACKTKFTCDDIPLNNRGVTDWSKLTNYMSELTERNEFICDLVIANIHRKIIVLTPRVEHAKLLCSMLVERGVNADYITSKKSKYKTGDVLVGSIGKINTGFDEKNYCEDFDGIPSNMLINAGSNKEPSLIMQIAGRLKRTNNTYLVDIVDDLKITLRHCKERKKIYEEQGYTYGETNGLFTVPEHYLTQ